MILGSGFPSRSPPVSEVSIGSSSGRGLFQGTLSLTSKQFDGEKIPPSVGFQGTLLCAHRLAEITHVILFTASRSLETQM